MISVHVLFFLPQLKKYISNVMYSLSSVRCYMFVHPSEEKPYALTAKSLDTKRHLPRIIEQ